MSYRLSRGFRDEASPDYLGMITIPKTPAQVTVTPVG